MQTRTKITKFLILRFSSIGDIVLTSPVLRCIHEQYPNAEIHFLTKNQFKSLVEYNPYISKIWLLGDSLLSIVNELRDEKFDYIIDLHHNLRTFIIKSLLWRSKSISFNKMNIEKWMYVQFKQKNIQISHVAERYLATLETLAIKDDQKGLDFFIPADQEISIEAFPKEFQSGYIAIIIGAKFATKKLPREKLEELCCQTAYPIAIIGGKEDEEMGKYIENKIQRNDLINLTGKYNLLQSASIIKQAKCIITNDTGMMHIASAFNKKIISVWGNTTPEIGFAPFRVAESIIIENNNIACRPCSKIGYHSCPQGHFKCMNDIEVKSFINELPFK